MTDELPTEQRDANAEIIERLARIEAGVAATNGRVTALESWRVEHQTWSEGAYEIVQAQQDALEQFKEQIDRVAVETLGKVTRTMQAMFNDAVKEATTMAIESYTTTEEGKQWFAETLAEHRRIEAHQREIDRIRAREERVQDFRRFGKQAAAVVVFALPFLQALNIFIGWIGGWTGWW